MEKACGSSLIGGCFCEPSFLLFCHRCYNAVTTRNIFLKYFGISGNLIKFANEM